MCRDRVGCKKDNRPQALNSCAEESNMRSRSAKSICRQIVGCYSCASQQCLRVKKSNVVLFPFLVAEGVVAREVHLQMKVVYG